MQTGIFSDYFNPRSREGSDLSSVLIAAISQAFQSALPRGERRATSVCVGGYMDFNPRSREGSDSSYLSNPDRMIISIRAPARGATRVMTVAPRQSEISIRAPARGATHWQMVLESTSWYFNPRSREGSDNTHSPSSLRFALFQSALPRGERQNT